MSSFVGQSQQSCSGAWGKQERPLIGDQSGGQIEHGSVSVERQFSKPDELGLGVVIDP